jgi:hypothetical protein
MTVAVKLTDLDKYQGNAELVRLYKCVASTGLNLCHIVAD